MVGISRRFAIASALTLLTAARAQGKARALRFVKPIGVGWGEAIRSWMSFVSFSADGSMVASDGPTTPDDTTEHLALWTFPEGRLIKRLAASPTALSADWKYYAGFHGVGEISSGKPLISVPEREYGIYAFSPDNRCVAASRDRTDGPSIRILELPSLKQVSAFGTLSAFALAISPDGRTLASGHWDTVMLWHMLTGERRAALRGFGRYVKGLSFSRDGMLLGAGTDFGGLQIWDVRRRARLHALSIEGGDVSTPAFSPDGTLMAVGIYGTGTAYLIDVATGRIIDHRKVSDLGCGSVAFSPDGRYLITPSTGGLIHNGGGTIRVFKIER